MLITLSACGYQLRGQVPGLASDQRLWVEGEDAQISNALKQSIVQSKATLITDKAQKSSANSIIILGEPEISQSASAYNSEGDVIEYNIYYRLRFSINDKSYTFNTASSYQYDKAQVLSSEQNKKVALQDMVDLASAYILRQL